MNTTFLARARWATMRLFFMSGMVYASWGLHVPTIKEKFSLNEAMLSLALFLITAGPVSIMPYIGAWIARIGGRAACAAGGLLMCGSAALILFVPWFALLLPVLALFGIGFSVLDVAMSAEAAAVETALGRPLMSSLHGMFSMGGVVGAALGGFLLSRGMSAPHHLLLASIIGAAIVLTAKGALLPHTPPAAAPGRKRRAGRALWVLGGFALVALIAEGAMYDWLTVYMHDVLAAGRGAAGAAFAVFSAGMVIGRLFGDAIRKRINDGRLILLSGALACAGMTLSLGVRYQAAALIGFTLTGVGLANMVPVIVGAAARSSGIHAAEGIARVVGIGYIGLLIGPVLIGLVAQASTLPIGLSLVAVCAALLAGFAPRILNQG